jgi:hypothetical protein
MDVLWIAALEAASLEFEAARGGATGRPEGFRPEPHAAAGRRKYAGVN